MDSSIMKIFQKELTCSICMNYFIDPITIDCGHSFCRPCVYLSWQDTSVLAHCSVCKGTTQQRDFKTNICIKKLSFLVRKASLQQFLSSEHYRCGLHKETKQIFCEDDGSLLCVRCSSAQEHEAHRHRPIEEAAEEHREKLLKKMHSLWNKSCENDRNLNVETITTRSWENYVNLKREEISAEYGKMPPFLHDEEQHHLERLQREGKEIFQKLKESKAKMAHKRELLRGVYKELKEMCHKPDIELLLGFGDILDRSEAMREHMPQAVNPELSGGPISGLVEKLSCFRVNITLEYERANSHVFLNGDFRSLSVGCDSRNEPHTAPRSECFLAWGAQALTPGKYYWEIQVEDSWNWAFGVCNDYWKENMNVQLDEKGLFLLGCAKNSIHYNIFTSSPLVLQYVPKPIGSVGVFLDYEGGTVSFVDVAQSSLICSISSCSFSPGLRPVFCCSHV
ncbi:tripartite motif-containing protein 51-like isoform X1 [Pteronotus mesoamericanus]|uniref:tripartite motif-containing protein 51-like isoform X1 n=1 Tax=Pteronotus mesoamericanus TaxID=1884717 RepID=UPI0023ECFFFB|nr:tripartite motif-containing protein 51-like isoform X1 [Pteronotus parnellii mesoamericanus]